MVTLASPLPQARRDPRSFLYFFAGSLIVVLIYTLGHVPLLVTPAPLPATHPGSAGNKSVQVHLDHDDGLGHDGEDGWYTSPDVNPYGKEGVDVSGFLTPAQHEASNENMQIEHVELRSQMTKDGKWFTIDFQGQGSFNPGFLPHPYKPDVWIMFAQRDKSDDDDDIWNTELVCEATYHEDKTMRCSAAPVILPIASTVTDQCKEQLTYMNDMIGPHDARVFYGPDRPYIIYGSQSAHSCLGQFIHDLRRLTPFWSNRTEGAVTSSNDDFFWATDLQRPLPYGAIEKNWFAFWDKSNEMYLHYDVKPTKRSFAKLNSDGSVGEDLAPLATSDDKCMKDLMPSLHANHMEWIHQATNSLSITLCKRLDPKCQATDDNTFNFILFQKKTFYYHGVYEPYVMLFKRAAPFEIHGISSKPFWYNGRGKQGEFWRWSTWKPKDQTQMVFTTQMSWQGIGMMYHGFLDDKIMISFGIEDKHGGGIDVLASDLLEGMAFCDQVG